MIRKAKAAWRGTGRDGAGDLTTDSGVLSETPYRIEYRVRQADGTYRWVFSQGVPQRGPDGKIENWVTEAGHIRLMQDLGWTRTTLKPGDVATFYFHPAKNGSHAVGLVKVTLSDGRTLGAHSSSGEIPAPQ